MAGPGQTPERDHDNFVADELIGLDPQDPETQEFAEHLKRMRQQTPAFTVEGYLAGVANFAESVNRADGPRRLGAIIVVLLLLLGAAFSVWLALGEIAAIFLG